MTAFDDALKLTLGFEGGVSNDPIDRGGLTAHGVTQGSYNRFRRLNALSTRPVTQITDAEVMSIYRTSYWLAAHCEELPRRLAMCVFDAAVNMGPTRAVKLLQEALGVSPDGIFGPKTKAAIAHADEGETIGRLLDARQDAYDDIIDSDPTQARFARGWANRVVALRDALDDNNIA